MKKRICALLLAAASLLSLAVAPAYATVENTTPATDACPCSCGKTLQEVSWQPWKGTAASGHFYLAEDYVQAEQTDVISGEKMVLDLRGKTISTSARIRLFHVSGYLAVLDTVGGGRLTARTPSAAGENGGVVSVADNETAGSTFELYSGTIMPSANAGKSQSGGLIDLGDGATFRMYGGMLLNGLTASNKHGGGIQGISSSTIEILGGSIVGCEAAEIGGSIYSTGTVILKNCSVIGGKAGSTGGNIYMNGGKLTVENAVIADGISFASGTYGGGNIGNVGGCKITISDSVIRGGYSYGYGGNMSLGYGTVNITNTEIYGGVANKGGTNIALTSSSAAVTLDGCTIDGGVGRVLGKLTLKGATKIGMYNGGLDLTAQSSKTTTATGLTSGAEVYIQGAKTLTGSLDYIKPLYRTTLSASGTTITMTQAADGVTAGYCPHCAEMVAWSAYGTEGAAHTYLTQSLSDFAEVTVSDPHAIDLAGYTITASGRAFTVTETGDLGILDSVGTGKVVGSGVDGENGGLFNNAGKLLLDGGKYTYTAKTGVAPIGGGVVYTSGELKIYGSQLVASGFASVDGVTTKGGAIRAAAGSTVKVTIRGARVNGGSAAYGGGAYFDYNSQVTIESATFTGGTASGGGGNIACGSSAGTPAATANNKGKLILTGVAVRDGESTTQYAGNLHIDRWNADITDCYLEGGSTAKYGGNLSYGVGNTMNVTNALLVGGVSEGAGGNFYAGGNTKNGTFTDCTFIGGSATSGGNAYINTGVITFKGGEFSHGTASADGGNLHANTAGGVTLVKNTAGQAPALLNGTAAGNGGNLYAADAVTVTDAYICAGSAAKGEDLYAAKGVTLTLGAGVTGNVILGADNSLLTADVFGGAISNITCSESAAKYYLGGEYGNCGIILKDKTMYVAVASVLDAEGDVWYSSNADAVADCGTDGYVKLFTGNDLVLTKDLYVDLNGNTVNVSGNHTFYGMDSSGDDFAVPAGKAILNGAAGTTTVTAPNGNTYIAITAGEESTYHRLDMKITGVNIRPSADGMYYSAKWSCDDTLKAKIDSFGVVASTAKMPNADFASDDANLWTTFSADQFENGKVQNGAVITGILKTEDRTTQENEANAKKPVYAKAYITFTDGTICVSGDNIRYSLYDVMKNLDRLIMEKPVQYRKFNLSAREFYEKWKNNGMGDWDLNKIPAPTEDDGVIDLLMVGHSFCYYYVEELYNLAKAEGISIRVCNLYYSGRSLETHYNRWVAGVSDYQLFEISDDTGGVRVGYANMGLESALAKYEWDYISLQAGTSGLLANGAQSLFESNKLYWESLLDYFIGQFPNARIGWHQSWSNQANEYGREDSSLTVENQTAWADEIDAYGQLVTDYYNVPAGKTVVQRINTGRAWQLCREDGYDYLCCRLGKTNSGVAHAGDGYHDGDIGGAQYLNACVWFEILTGQSVVGNTYIPEYKTTSTIGDELLGKLHVEKTTDGYKLTDAFAAQLQNYAHEAVALLEIPIAEE